jgi:hypothetical protein
MVSDKRDMRTRAKARLLPRRLSVLIGRQKSSKRTTALATTLLGPLPLRGEQIGPSTELLRYRRGELTEAEYLAGRIEAATAHLKGRVSRERLDMVKQVIAQRLETDPLLVEARAQLRDPDFEPTEDPEE